MAKKKNYFNEEVVSEMILHYQKIVETATNAKGKPIVINKTREIINLENNITTEVMKIVNAIIFYYSYQRWEPVPDLQSVGIDACFTNYLKFNPESGTAFNFFSIITKKCLFGYTKRREKKRNIQSLEERVDIRSPKYNNMSNFFFDDLYRTLDNIIDCNFVKKKRNKYKIISGVLYDYLKKTRMYISKSDFYKFSSIYGIKPVEIRAFVSEMKEYVPNIFLIIDKEEDRGYSFEDLKVDDGKQ